MRFSSIGWIGVIFLVLKLCGVIEWSWWFVTMPFYLGLVLGWIADGLLWCIETPEERRLRKLKEKYNL